ncbi:MAG TPA: helix-turn-helix transcriptional regulator [Flavobacteriaceae bacterium]|nr:helix-turn-helix domain-containing protein [Flavobacteriaceae bacterium]HPF12594.1 helix-turn-helix transcriptional regulator [Flavobacteriaceae bacterium]HQU22412.1 helix-turn-helix transcriptional regulator [Flavobacteriaceae bacterium]HQU66337.1 helix-turn-helix transcriptional regulator [Flavobacteriaceae bacterium]HRW43681.1 helix-turn-helix transcriptional regulator [Flavobacteriaceae bacterium]
MKTELEIKDKTKLTEGLKISLFRQHIRKTSPHRHNDYFEIIFLTKGLGSHTIDTKVYEIEPPIIFTIRKEQVHFWDIKTEPEGFVLIIKKTYIDNCLDRDIKALISELSAQTCLYPKDNTAIDMFRLLLVEHQEDRALNRQITDGLLKALLAKLLGCTTPRIPKKGNGTIFQRLIDLLNRVNGLTNKVSHYARLLNTTPQNLNAICRKETGQSSAEILSEHIINEAKRLLLYTDLTVGEIAHRLDFKDNSHFCKYFKRHVKQTPICFRNDSH